MTGADGTLTLSPADVNPLFIFNVVSANSANTNAPSQRIEYASDEDCYYLVYGHIYYDGQEEKYQFPIIAKNDSGTFFFVK